MAKMLILRHKKVKLDVLSAATDQMLKLLLININLADLESGSAFLLHLISTFSQHILVLQSKINCNI